MAVALLLLLTVPSPAAAHPLGNFTVNRYSRLEPDGDRLRIIYVLDMAEVPAFQEQRLVDGNSDGQVSESEQNEYAARKASELQQGVALRLDGKPAALTLMNYELSFPPGQGGLSLLRLRVVFEAAVPAGATLTAEYQDRNYSSRMGWKEVVVRASAGTAVLDSDAPTTDQSDELRTYPNDMLSSPLDRTTARFRSRAGADGQTAGVLAAVAPAIITRPLSEYAALVSVEALSLPVILISLLVAAFWGAMHSLSPGHGKTLVAAYLVGARGTVRHALFLGLTVTLTHTVGVYALGLVTLFAARYILPEQLYPWLSLLSGLIVVAMGAVLFRQRLAATIAGRTQRPQPAAPALVAAGHDHDHWHAHDHAHDNDHHQQHRHDEGHHHDHAHDHDHHRDHGHGHTHLPPGADGRPVTWRSLLAMGVSGGLLPCPSALVVMLGAIALDRVTFGLLLVLAFSLGLAAVLIAFGLLLVAGSRLFVRLPVEGRLLRLGPAGSALTILIIGLLATAQALTQLGLVPR